MLDLLLHHLHIAVCHFCLPSPFKDSWHTKLTSGILKTYSQHELLIIFQIIFLKNEKKIQISIRHLTFAHCHDCVLGIFSVIHKHERMVNNLITITVPPKLKMGLFSSSSFTTKVASKCLRSVTGTELFLISFTGDLKRTLERAPEDIGLFSWVQYTPLSCVLVVCFNTWVNLIY